MTLVVGKIFNQIIKCLNHTVSENKPYNNLRFCTFTLPTQISRDLDIQIFFFNLYNVKYFMCKKF